MSQEHSWLGAGALEQSFRLQTSVYQLAFCLLVTVNVKQVALACVAKVEPYLLQPGANVKGTAALIRVIA